MGVEGVGGDAMRAAGARLIAHADRLSAMGLCEAAASLPRHLGLLRRLTHALRTGRYTLAVVVDYPGFHLRVARAAARCGVPVLYYIAPQLWAWGRWRLPLLRAHVRRLAVILPFEQPFFRSRGVPSTFVGHPLLDHEPPPARLRARRQVGMPPEAPLLALFPGRRAAERRRLWPAFRIAARLLRRDLPGLEVAVAAADPGADAAEEGIRSWAGEPAVLAAAADAALCKSGTTTLEAALAGLPHVVAYRLHPVTYAVARGAVTVPHVGLVNLLAGRLVTPELLQAAATPERLARAVLPLLDRDGRPAREQREAFAAVRATLGTPGAGRRVAALALELAA